MQSNLELYNEGFLIGVKEDVKYKFGEVFHKDKSRKLTVREFEFSKYFMAMFCFAREG